MSINDILKMKENQIEQARQKYEQQGYKTEQQSVAEARQMIKNAQRLENYNSPNPHKDQEYRGFFGQVIPSVLKGASGIVNEADAIQQDNNYWTGANKKHMTPEQKELFDKTTQYEKAMTAYRALENQRDEAYQAGDMETYKDLSNKLNHFKGSLSKWLSKEDQIALNEKIKIDPVKTLTNSFNNNPLMPGTSLATSVLGAVADKVGISDALSFEGPTVREAVQRNNYNKELRNYYEENPEAFLEFITPSNNDIDLGNYANDYSLEQDINLQKEALGRDPDLLDTMKIWGKGILNNPATVADVAGDSVNYLIPGVGSAKLLTDVSRARSQIYDTLHDKRGTEFLNEEDKAIAELASAGLLASNYLSKGIFNKAFKGTGIGNTVSKNLANVNDKLGKTISGTVARKTAGATTTGIAEGSQEVLQSSLEKLGARERLSNDDIAQSFLLGAASTAPFTAIGETRNAVKALSKKTPNKESVKDVLSKDHDPMDLNSKYYDPSRVVRNELKNNVNNRVDADTLNTSESNMIQAVENTKKQFKDLKAQWDRHETIQDDLVSQLDILENPNSSDADISKADTKLKELQNELASLTSKDILEPQLDKTNKAVQDIEKEYSKAHSRISTIRQKAGLPVTKPYEIVTEASQTASDSDVKTKATDSTSSSTSEYYRASGVNLETNPVEGIKSLIKKTNEYTPTEIVKNTTSDIQASIDKLDSKIKASNAIDKTISNIDNQLTESSNLSDVEIENLTKQKDQLINTKKAFGNDLVTQKTDLENLFSDYKNKVEFSRKAKENQINKIKPQITKQEGKLKEISNLELALNNTQEAIKLNSKQLKDDPTNTTVERELNNNLNKERKLKLQLDGLGSKNTATSRLQSLKNNLYKLEGKPIPKKEEKKENSNNLKPIKVDTVRSMVTNKINGILKSNKNLSSETVKKLKEVSRVLDNVNDDLKNLPQVSKEIREGGEGFKGLSEYETNIVAAIDSKDSKKFKDTLNSLNKFKISHQSKANALNKAYKEFVKDSTVNKLVYREAGKLTWAVSNITDFSKVSQKEKKETGAIEVHYGTKQLITSVNTEANAINDMFNNLQKLEKDFNTITSTNSDINNTTIADIKDSTPFVENVTRKHLKDSTAGNFYFAKDGKLRSRLTIKSNDKLRKFLREQEKVAENAHRVIAFGFRNRQDGQVSNNQETRVRTYGFKGRQNIVTNYSAKYKSDEIVALFHENTKDNPAIEAARKAELDAVGKAGATIKVLPAVWRKKATKLNEDIKYIQDTYGYVEDNNTGIFTKKIGSEIAKNETIEKTKNVEEVKEKNQSTTNEPEHFTIDPPSKEKTWEYAKHDLYNAMKAEDWTPIVNTPVSLEVTDKSGKLNLDKHRLSQKDTPLNKQPQFFEANLANKDWKAIEKITGYELTQNNKNQLESFIRLRNKLAYVLPKALKKPNTIKGLLNNPLYNEIIKDTKNLDSNLITAISIGLFQHIQHNGMSGLTDKDTTLKTHGLASETHLNYKVINQLRDWGGYQGFTFQEIGKNIVSALGLKLEKDANVHLLYELESHLGALAYTAVAQDEVNPFFKETVINLEDKTLTIINGLMFNEAKSYVINNGLVSSSLFQDKDSIKTKEALISYIKNDAKTNSKWKKSSTFVRPHITTLWDKKTKEALSIYNPEILDILMSSNKSDGSKDVLNDLFQTGKEKIKPRNEPIKEISQRTVKKADTAIPSNMKGLLTKAAQNTWTIDSDKADFIIDLFDNNPDKFFRFMGIIPDFKLELMHPTLREMRIADNSIKKDLLTEQINYLKELKEQAKTTENKTGKYANYYQVPVVWVNQRVGYESTLWNAQTNLFARMLSSMKDWETEFEFNRGEFFSEDGKVNAYGLFLTALAQNMEGISKYLPFDNLEGVTYGINARTVDKVRPQDFLPMFEDFLLNNQGINEAVSAIRSYMDSGTMTPEEEKAVQSAIDEFDMEELGFGALLEITKFKDSLDNNATKYKTQLGVQSDGITNGPIITKILLAVADEQIKLMGGVITKEQSKKFKNYFETKAAQLNDLYERTAEAMQNELQLYIPHNESDNTSMAQAVKALLAIDDKFGNRKWAKKLLTPFNYGAGLERLRSTINGAVVDQFHKEYYDLYSKQGQEREDAINIFGNKLVNLTNQYNNIFIHNNSNILKNPLDEGQKLLYIEGVHKDPMSLTLDQIVDHFIKQFENNQNIRAYAQALKESTSAEKSLKIQKELLNYISIVLRNKNKPVPHFSFDPTNNKNIVHIDVTKDLPIVYTNMLNKLSNLTLAQASSNAIEKTEEDYIVIRNMLTTYANMAQHNFALLRDIVTKKIAGPNAHAHNLTVGQKQQIENELKNYRAAVSSGMSNLNIIQQDDGTWAKDKAISSGINLENKMTSSKMLDNALVFNKIYRSTSDSNNRINYNYGYTYVSESAPGARSLALMIQSVDSGISAQAIGNLAGMNFHDANVFGLNDFIKGVGQQNINFYKTVMNYEPAIEIFKAYMRPFYKMKEIYNDQGTSADLKATIETVINERAEQLDDFIDDLDSAYSTELTKLKRAENDAIIQQYGGTDGEIFLKENLKDKFRKKVSRVAAQKTKQTEYVSKFFKTFYNAESTTVSAIDSLTAFMTKGLSSEERSKTIKEILTSKTVNINEYVDLIHNLLPESVDQNTLDLLSKLKDTDLSNVKIKFVDGNANQKRFFDNSQLDYYFSKFNNTVYIDNKVIQDGGQINHIDLMRAVFAASMHHNLKAFKNGSKAYKEMAEDYAALKLVSNNLLTYADKAYKESLITTEELNKLKDIFAVKEDSKGNIIKRGRAGNVEYLMDSILHDSTTRDILHKIPAYTTVKTNQESILNKVGKFIIKIISGGKVTDFVANESLGQLIFNTTEKTKDTLIKQRSSRSIQEMIKESFKPHTNLFSRESDIEALNTYDTRMQYELYSLKINKGQSALSALSVLNTLENILTTGFEYNSIKSPTYEGTLLPVVQMLKNSLNNSNKVFLVESARELENEGFSEEMLEDVAEAFANGSAFEHAGNVYLPTPSISSNSNVRASTLVHELIHAMTKRSIEQNPDIVNKLDTLRQEVLSSIELDKAHPDVIYALEDKGDKKVNAHEFVAQVMSKYVVRQALLNHKTNEDTPTLTEFYQDTATLLNLDLDLESNALKSFNTLFGELRHHIAEGGLVPTRAAPQVKTYNEKTIKLKKGLEAVGYTTNADKVARNINYFFNNGIVDITKKDFDKVVERVLNSIDDVETRKTISNYIYNKNSFYTEAKANIETFEDLNKTIRNLSNNLEDLIHSLADNNYARQAEKILLSNKQQMGLVTEEERFNPKTIFNFLGNSTKHNNEYLEDVIDNIVQPLINNVDKELISGYEYKKVWHDAVLSGQAVYATSAYNSGYRLDDQQAYVLEILEVALKNSIDNVVNTGVYRQLEKTYQEAKERVSPKDFHKGDWDNTTQEERDLANAKYNYVFTASLDPEGKSDYLTNFIALSIVSPELQDILSFSTDRQLREKGWFEKVVNVFKNIVEQFENQQTVGLRSANVSNRISGLAEQLAQIHFKHHDTAVNNKRSIDSQLENLMDTASEKVVDIIEKASKAATNAPIIKDTRLGKIANKTLNQELEGFNRFINEVMDVAKPNSYNNDITEFMNEVAGTLDNGDHEEAKDLFYTTKFIEQKRGSTIENVAKHIKESFSKENQELELKKELAITNGLLRTDLQVLLNTMDFSSIMNLIKDSKELNSLIKSLEKQLEKSPNGKEFMIRAEDLAYYLVNRKSKSNLLAKNAFAIVDRAGMLTVDERANHKFNQQDVKTVDQLISLYALRLTKPEHKKELINLYNSELLNKDKEITGLEYTIKVHKEAVEKSNELFTENPYSQVKGFLPNMTNPIKGFEVVPIEEVEHYKSMGYVEQTVLDKSSLEDKDTKPMVLMTISNTGKQRYVSGTLSIEDTIASGTIIDEGNRKLTSKRAAKAKLELQQAINGSVSNDIEGTTLIPVYRNDGTIKEFRYEMSHVGLDNFLDRDNTSSTLLSHLIGTNLSKAMFPHHNENIIDNIISAFDKADPMTKLKYVEVSPVAKDSRGRDLWHSLPRATQIYIENQNGDKFLYVRNDEVSLLFGYRKYGLNEIFKKDSSDRNVLEHIYAGLFQFFFGKKAELRSNQIESFWQEAIAKLKDFIVIRGVQVLVDNIISNIALTLVNKAAPREMVKDIKDALTYSLKYQKDMQELSRLELDLRIGLYDPAKLSKYAEIKDAITRNPLKSFIEAGMMPMIVNDISFQQEQVKFKSGVDILYENTIGKLSEPIQKGFSYLFVSPETPHYNFLVNATQQSDFVFKYAVYKQEKRLGKSNKEALNTAKQLFIEYDIPTSKSMQALNDNGIWMFTKFSLRYVRVMLHMFRTRKARLVSETVLSNLFGNQSLWSMSFLGTLWRMGNPLRLPIDDVLTMYNHAFPIQIIKRIFD